MKFNKLSASVLSLSFLFVANAHGYETAAQNAILVDYETGEYLFEKI